MRDGVKKETSWFILLVFVSGILLFLDKKGWIKSVRGLAEQPILAAEREIYNFHNAWLQPGRNFFLSKNTFEKELLRLQVDLQKLAVDQNKYNTCQTENEKIRKLLGTNLPPSWKLLLAHVTGLTDLMHLDVGEKQQVKIGMGVVSDNLLVGKVIEVSDYGSLVQLPNSTGARIPVVIKRPNAAGIQARGLLIGQYGGQLLLDKVLQAEDIKKGDLVVSSGDEGFLADLVIGQINDVLGKSAELYQRARVEPLVDYRQLTVVFIVIK